MRGEGAGGKGKAWGACVGGAVPAALPTAAVGTAPRLRLAPARSLPSPAVPSPAEGYALDWSPVLAGRLASGDCRSRIHVWEPAPGGRWAVGPAFRGHQGSVEDLQWSPSEETVFASASVDKTIRIWDTREQVGWLSDSFTLGGWEGDRVAGCGWAGGASACCFAGRGWQHVWWHDGASSGVAGGHAGTEGCMHTCARAGAWPGGDARSCGVSQDR